MSRRPQALQKVLDHVNRAIKGTKIEIYRIVPIEEVTQSLRPALETKPARPAGIAIVEANSLEEVRRKLERFVEGVKFGGLPVSMGNYLDFEINPLVEIGHGGKE